MFFSKTFGYAIRSILYLASLPQCRRASLKEISDELRVPRYFLAKVMKKLASERVISSQKGPAGGFACNEITRSVSLLQLAAMTNETNQFGSCLLRLRKCNPQNPCPLHHQAQVLKDQWLNLLCYTTIGQLVEGEHKNFIGSITAA